MKNLVWGNTRVRVMPFLPHMPATKHQRTRPEKVDSFEFFYPSGPFVHKNHECLLTAWAQMSKNGIQPKLKLTTEKEEMTEKSLELIATNSLNIEFLGSLEYDDVFHHYLNSDAMIFPSLRESLGLPLLEAQHVGLPILASEREFVSDVISGPATFDPLLPNSIKSSVMSFLETEPREPIQRKFVCQNVIEAL